MENNTTCPCCGNRIIVDGVHKFCTTVGCYGPVIIMPEDNNVKKV